MTLLLYFLIWWLFSCDLMNFLLWFKMWWLSSYGLWFDDFPLLFLIWWLSSVCDPMYWRKKNHEKNDRNGSYMAERNLQISSGICPVPFVLRQCTMSLHENMVFSVCACMDNAAYIIFIIWNSFSGLDAWYHFRFNVSYGVAVTVRSHQIKFQVIF